MGTISTSLGHFPVMDLKKDRCIDYKNGLDVILLFPFSYILIYLYYKERVLLKTFVTRKISPHKYPSIQTIGIQTGHRHPPQEHLFDRSGLESNEVNYFTIHNTTI